MPPLSVAWSYGVMVVVVIVAAIADLRTRKIHKVITYPAIALGLIGHTLVGGLTGESGGLGLAGSLAGFAVGFVPLLIAFLAGGINGGDVKLMGAVGALGGWRLALSAMFLGFLAAVVLSVIVMIRRRIVKRTLGRVGRFFLLALTPGGIADPTSPDSPKVSFGLALCIGTLAALAEVLLSGPDAVKLLVGY